MLDITPSPRYSVYYPRILWRERERERERTTQRQRGQKCKGLILLLYKQVSSISQQGGVIQSFLRLLKTGTFSYIFLSQIPKKHKDMNIFFFNLQITSFYFKEQSPKRKFKINLFVCDQIKGKLFFWFHFIFRFKTN